MSRFRPIILPVLALSLVASLGYAWWLHGQLAATQAELAASREDLLLQRRAPHLIPPPPHQAASPLSLPSLGNPPAASRAGGPAATSTQPPASPGPAALRDSPEMQRLIALQRRAALDGRYAALFRKLNLNSTDLENFKALLVERQSAANDVFSAARAEGLNPRDNRGQIAQLVAKYEAEVDASIRETLGESVFQQYQQYEQTLPQRNVANQLEQRLSYSSTPLSGNQTEQLVRVLATTTPAAPANNLATLLPPGVNLPRNVSITDATLAQSQAFLSAPQIEALRQLQQEQAVQAQLRQQMQQTRRNGADGSMQPTTGPSGR